MPLDAAAQQAILNHPILSLFEQPALKKLYKHGELMQVASGTAVFREGEIGDSLYLIKSGEVETYIQAGTERVTLSRLQDGDLFGEVAVVTGQPRTGTVVANVTSELICFRRRTLARLLMDRPAVTRKLLELIDRRANDTISKIQESLGS